MINFKVKIRQIICLLSLLLCFYTIPGKSQDYTNISEAREAVVPLLFEYKLDEALAIIGKLDQNKYEVVALTSVIYSLRGNQEDNESDIEKGFAMLEPYQSITDSDDIHVAFAVSYGIQANQVGLRKQSELAGKSVEHSKEALKLMPDLPHPNFILGRFYYELAGMNSFTAGIAKAFINAEDIDKASYELALSYLKKSSDLAPTRFLYNYYTGAAYMELDEEENAMIYFKRADKNERYTEDDREADEDLQKQLR